MWESEACSRFACLSGSQTRIHIGIKEAFLLLKMQGAKCDTTGKLRQPGTSKAIDTAPRERT